MIDMVVHRHAMRPTIARLVRLMTERRQQTKRLGYEVGNGRRS